MEYNIQGDKFPVLICNLNDDESIITQGCQMSWMSPNIQLTRIDKRADNLSFGKDNYEKLQYKSKNGYGMIAFASDFPGEIIPVNLDGTEEYICMKNSFLVSTDKVKASTFIKEDLNATLFGSDGFVMEKLSGKGIAFLELHGSAMPYTLAEDQNIVVETGRIVIMSSSCKMKIVKVKGSLNPLYKNEETYNTVVYGPGKILLQTMPMDRLTEEVLKRVPLD